MSRGSRPGCANGAQGPKCSPHGEGARLALSTHLHRPALQVLMVHGQDKKGHRPQASIVLNSFTALHAGRFT